MILSNYILFFFDKYFYFFIKYVVKRKEVLQRFLVERRGGFLWGAIWFYLSFSVIYASSEKKIKGLNRRIRRLENKWKEIKTCLDFRRIERPNGHRYSDGVDLYEIIDIDEDWVKLTRDS